MQEIEAALDAIRPGLDGDGFELRLESVEPDGTVRIGLHARDGACLDCLVPDDILLQIIDMNIRERTDAVGDVVLEKFGF
jgi:Fe-S cluster biogenesis protein NfuA